MLTSSLAQKIQQIKEHSALKELNLRACLNNASAPELKELFEAMTMLSNLRVLDLANNHLYNLTNEQFNALCNALQQFSKLEELNLFNTKLLHLSEAHFTALCQAIGKFSARLLPHQPSPFKSLILEGNRLLNIKSDNKLSALCNLIENLKDIKALSLTGINLEDAHLDLASFQSLCTAISQLPGLEALSIRTRHLKSSNSIPFLQTLCNLIKNLNLKRLNLVLVPYKDVPPEEIKKTTQALTQHFSFLYDAIDQSHSLQSLHINWLNNILSCGVDNNPHQYIDATPNPQNAWLCYDFFKNTILQTLPRQETRKNPVPPLLFLAAKCVGDHSDISTTKLPDELKTCVEQYRNKKEAVLKLVSSWSINIHSDTKNPKSPLYQPAQKK